MADDNQTPLPNVLAAHIVKQQGGPVATLQQGMQPTAIAQAASEALAGQERLHRGGLAQGRLDRHIAGGLTSPELAQMAGTPQRPGIAKSLSERLVPKTDPQQR